MAQPLEVDYPSDPPPPDLLDRNVLSRILFVEKRMIVIVAHNGQEQLDAATCQISASKTQPPITFKLGIAEAGKIATTRDALMRQR